jgi:glycosyltransferase involved in cell wall biosynthesis
LGSARHGYRLMKLAFVNQPIDTILPPYQSSVGACTYGAGCSLARHCSVLVYGAQSRNRNVAFEHAAKDVEFRLFPFSIADRVTDRIRDGVSRLSRNAVPQSTSFWNYPIFGRRVARDLGRQHCDVIHIQHCSAYIPFIRALNPSSRIILHLHAEWFSQNNPASIKRRLKDVDLVTTVSHYVTEKTRRMFPEIADRCETTYNGIDASEFGREKEYGVRKPSRKKTILYAGAVSPHKGTHVLIEAFNRIAAVDPDVQLRIVGPHNSYGPEETFDLVEDRACLERIEHFYSGGSFRRILPAWLGSVPANQTYVSHLMKMLTSDSAPRVSFAGMIPRQDLVQSYYDADVFVFPSIWNEGFGIPPVEAMAAGTPVVATPSGAVAETVRDGETGYLVNKNDPVALADRILCLLRDEELMERMGRAGRRRASENFTWDRVADRMFTRYQLLCEAPPVRVASAASPVHSYSSQ